MTNKKDELRKLKARGAELEARIAKLEADAKPEPPPKPFVPEPYQRYDPTANMCMPRSAMEAMVAAEPRGFMAGVVHDNRAPTGRPGAIPSSTQVAGNRAPANVPGGGTGWVNPSPLSPPPGINYVDAQLDAQDAKDRQERIQQATAADTARKLAAQGEKLQTLIEQNKRLMERMK